MIGLYGIIAKEDILNKNDRSEAFVKMSNHISKNDFINKTYGRTNFSIGITTRGFGENKDLSIKAVDNDIIIAFAGYGKLSGETKLFWAEEMIEKIIPLFKESGLGTLSSIEGSFQCLIFADGQLIIISDRFSSKNLFYYDAKDIFIFAPDVGRLISSGIIPKEKNIYAATQILLSGFFLDDSTLVNNIFRFPYASLFIKDIHDPSKSKMSRYWNVPKTEGTIDSITPELVESLSDKLQQSIYELSDLENRAIIPLSGGLDSRTIACFISKKQKLKTLTYDMGDETKLSNKVCKKLFGEPYYFSNDLIISDYFRKTLYDFIYNQNIHSVPNQYFYAPLFKEYFMKHKEDRAIYDGVYMDILFSAPYTNKIFDFDRFNKTYGGKRTSQVVEISYSLDEADLKSLMKNIYNDILLNFDESDGVGKSQLFYATGRLRRYCTESFLSRENYCYVFKPGYNYELMNFGFNLSLRIRKGLLYTTLLRKMFPEVMSILYKDSYGNREKTFYEKIHMKYKNIRLNISAATRGLIMYPSFQTEYLFLKKKEIANYNNLFLHQNNINELLDDSSLTWLFNMVMKKQYLFNLFQRVLFLQQFYNRFNF